MIMKNVIYYSVLILCFIILLLLISSVLVLTGIIPFYVSFDYSLGRACSDFRLWIACIGIVMLLRDYMYRIVFKENKKFPKTNAVTITLIGLIFFLFSKIYLFI